MEKKKEMKKNEINYHLYKSEVKNEDLRETLKRLKQAGYTYIIKAQDKFLSGWGYAKNNKHVQLIATTKDTLQTTLNDLYNDNTMLYVNFYRIENLNNIIATTRNKTFSVRNDWTRTLNDTQKEDNKKMCMIYNIVKDIYNNNVCLGYREIATLENLKDAEIGEIITNKNDEELEHLTIKLYNNDNDFILYDFITKKIVG
jgi:hypothetical protein